MGNTEMDAGKSLISQGWWAAISHGFPTKNGHKNVKWEMVNDKLHGGDGRHREDERREREGRLSVMDYSVRTKASWEP